ncbi:MAG: ABC transporter permease [Gammaproteobacteria bacterium]|nr:ABC transporter permease [Gammaproteobacteria bacterium]
MKYLFLIRAGLWRKPVRTILTALATIVAFLLFGVMHGVTASFDEALDLMSDTRLRVMSRANFLEPMPLAHRARIEQLAGVTRVAHLVIFPAYYQDLRNGISAAALSVEDFLEVFPEIKVPEEQQQAMQRTRTGAIVGHNLARKYGWQIGDIVPLKSMLWTRDGGSQDWAVEIVAIANAGPDDEQIFASELYFNYEFLDESRATSKGTVHQFIVGLESPELASSVAKSIDELFANSADETNTLDEKQYLTSMVGRLGNVGYFVNAVLGAVLFTLLFLTGTTMAQSARDRVSEFGILKAIGFTDTSVFMMVVVESMILSVLAAGVGLGIAATVFPSVFAAFGLAGITLAPSVYLLGLAIAAVLAVCVSVWPAWRSRSLSIAEAMSGR